MEPDPEEQAGAPVEAVPARDAAEAEAGAQDRGANVSVLSAVPKYRIRRVHPAALCPARSAALP
jgi:hypothetical protein